MTTTPKTPASSLFRWLRRAALLAIWLITLLVLAVVIENWRGRRVWNAYVADAEARGERLDPQSVIPPSVPDAENFAKAPIFLPRFDYVLDDTTHEPHWRNPAAKEALDNLDPTPKGKPIGQDSWRYGHFVDLAAWQRLYRERPEFPKNPQSGTAGEDVLEALSKFDQQYAGLRAACARPETQFPNHYAENVWMILPILGEFKSFARIASPARFSGTLSSPTGAGFRRHAGRFQDD